MTARLLVVDDIEINARLLEARLSAEYYTVIICNNGHDAIEICRRGECDLVLLDVMMPELSGFEVCRTLKSDPETLHIPIVLVTALDSVQDRVEGLEAGADDFLTKPVSDVALLARVKSLLRLKLLVDELRMRALTAHDVKLEALFECVSANPTAEDEVIIIDDRESSASRMRKALERTGFRVSIQDASQSVAIDLSDRATPILAIINLDMKNVDGLRVCSDLRMRMETRNLPLLAVCDEPEGPKLAKALDLGVNDYIARPVEINELQARTMTQLRRKRYADYLHESVQNTLEMAIKDSLTGLYNRRYFETHLANHLKMAVEKDVPLSILMLDIDHFKQVNDTHGHDVGDAVLKEFGKRLEDNVRRIDLPCRIGGEEFVVIMPETDRMLAEAAAERIRTMIAQKAFLIDGATSGLSVTTSIGISCLIRTDDTAETLLKRADVALYQAKSSGRNCIFFSSAA